VVVPVGVVLAIAIHVDGFETAQIIHAAALTAFFTAVMMIAGMVWSDFFLSLGKILFVGLLAIVIFETACLIFRIYLPTIWDILVAALFCGYIAYDWAKAQKESPTADNAVDACVDLYLDIINLFIRILSSSSNSRSKSSRK
jgi:FtsH-binding integral membrane protein